jgi:hypothetical protein
MEDAGKRRGNCEGLRLGRRAIAAISSESVREESVKLLGVCDPPANGARRLGLLSCDRYVPRSVIVDKCL